MELASGHSVHLKPENSAPAILVKLPEALKRALLAAQQSGERVAFRCSGNNGTMQATISVGLAQHQFTGTAVARHTALRLSTLEDVPGAVVANIGCKIHQQKSLQNSNIGSRIRASAEAEKQGRGQTQVLDHVPPQNGSSRGRSVTPPPVVHRSAAAQVRQKTPPPAVGSASTSYAVGNSSKSQVQTVKPTGRSATPPNPRATPPPSAARQQQQQPPIQQRLSQQPQRPQAKSLSKEPPKPKSLSGGKQQQRRTPPPAIFQQHAQRSTSSTAAPKIGAALSQPSVAPGPGTAAVTSQPPSLAASRLSPAPPAAAAAPSAAPVTGAGVVQAKSSAARPPMAGGGSTVDKTAVQRGGNGTSKPNSRGVSPAVGSLAGKQQQARAAMPLISVQPLPQAPKAAGDRRSPAPSATTQQQQQQRSRLQQGSQGSRPATVPSAANSKQQTAASQAARPSSASSKQQQQQQDNQQQQQAKKRPALKRPAFSIGYDSEVAPAAKAAKLRHLNELSAVRAGSKAAAVGGTANQQKGRKAVTQQQQLKASTSQPVPRGASPTLPAVGGQWLNPDGSSPSAEGSPSQQQQHTKHWFTSSEESGGTCSVGDQPASAAGKSLAAAGPTTAVAVGSKRKRDFGSSTAAEAPPQSASTSAAQQSWVAAMQAKKQQQAGKPAIDPAAAKSSWQAALRRQSPPQQTAGPDSGPRPSQQQQQQQSQEPTGKAVAQDPGHKAANVTAAKAAVAVDLGPPGYHAYVDRIPRSFSPISTEQEYQQYIRQYDTLYAMYISLHNLIEASIRSVKQAHERMAAESLGSAAHLEAKQQLQQKLTSKAELTQRWNRALGNLHLELLALRTQLQQWVHTKRTLAASAMGGSIPAHVQVSNAGSVSAAQHQPALGGKGLLLAAYGRPPATCVGA